MRIRTHPDGIDRLLHNALHALPLLASLSIPAEHERSMPDDIIPNTAVFGPTNFIGTIASARMKISDEDFGWRFRMKI